MFDKKNLKQKYLNANKKIFNVIKSMEEKYYMFKNYIR